MSMDDKNSAQYYDDPANREPTASPGIQRRGMPGLSKHVPIRFSPETIAKVQILAARVNLTVSSWIRGVVERRVAELLPKEPSTGIAAEVDFESLNGDANLKQFPAVAIDTKSDSNLTLSASPG
jgi:hypothetical protein